MKLLQSDRLSITKPKISIIVPVYNGEEYLERCIDSIILAAEGHNIELILIDDGSEDNSASIAQEYCDNFPWIKLIRQENQGPSVARNIGLATTQGEYIGFVDCDDCVSKDYFSELLTVCASKPDIVVFGYQKIFSDGKEQIFAPKSKEHFDEQESLLCNVNNDRELFWFPWTKVFRSDLITRIRFDEYLRLGEDTIFNLNAIKNSNKIVRISSVLYYHHEILGSLSSNKYKPNLLQNMERHFLLRLAVHEDTKRGLNDAAWCDIYDYYIFHILPWLFSNLMSLDKKQQLKELRIIRNASFVERCYSKKLMLGKGPRTIIIQSMFRTSQIRLLRAYLATTVNRYSSKKKSKNRN